MAAMIALIVLVAVSCPVLAQDEPNCDPKAGLIDGSCVREPDVPWWTCNRYMYRKPEATPEQLRRLENFGFGIFSPIPGYGLAGPRFSRDDVIRRLGQPLSAKSRKVPRDPRDPTDKVLWDMTTWEYPGFRITTGAGPARPDRLWLEEAEIFGANVPLPHGVRIGQSIERWARQFGQPDCNHGGPQGSERYLVYTGEADYSPCENEFGGCLAIYQIDVFLDGSGRVRRIKWFHPEGH